jgi:hypothetical protein
VRPIKMTPRPAYQGAGRQAVDGRGPVCPHFSPLPRGGQALRLPDGRAVAKLVGDVLVARRRGSLHRLRRPPAWALDTHILAEAERLGARWVVIEDTESGQEHWAHLTTLRRHGFSIDRGHGRQVALPLNWWRPTRAEALRLAERLEAVQLPLPGFVGGGR